MPQAPTTVTYVMTSTDPYEQTPLGLFTNPERALNAYGKYLESTGHHVERAGLMPGELTRYQLSGTRQGKPWTIEVFIEAWELDRLASGDLA